MCVKIMRKCKEYREVNKGDCIENIIQKQIIEHTKNNKKDDKKNINKYINNKNRKEVT